MTINRTNLIEAILKGETTVDIAVEDMTIKLTITREDIAKVIAEGHVDIKETTSVEVANGRDF